jgi:hypothetical protein
MANVNKKCFWYCKDYTQCTDKDYVPRDYCELRGELDVEPNYCICNYCKRFIDKEEMKEKLENKRKREEQNKDKWEISWE